MISDLTVKKKGEGIFNSGKINLFGVNTGKKESCLETRVKLTLSIAYVQSDCKFG